MMRNLSIDTANHENYKYRDLVNLAESESRIIITRNKIIKNNVKNLWIHLKEAKVETQMKQLIKFLDLTIKNSELMSRCVKCNHGTLDVIDYSEAIQQIMASGYQVNADMESVETFWICGKCQQVYWEGGQFANAKKNYQAFVTHHD